MTIWRQGKSWKASQSNNLENVIDNDTETEIRQWFARWENRTPGGQQRPWSMRLALRVKVI